jgi:hypothetical protein
MFSLQGRVILPLALGAVKELDSKFRCATTVVKHQELAVAEIMVYGKLRPAASKINIVITIIMHLQLVWRPPLESSRMIV